MSTISVIIPAYNRAHLIGETLSSLLMQTTAANEIIVVDDGSTDNTAAVAKSFGPPVKVICRVNGGPAAARNTGFHASSGEYIHFFDSDDLAAANKQEIQLAALEATGADIAIGPLVQGRFDGNRFAASNHVQYQHGLPSEKNLIKVLLTHWSFLLHAALFRRSIVEKAAGFSEDLFGPEDQFMFLGCLLAGARVVHTPGTIEFYRQGDGGKITENMEWAVLRLREWARFLIKARKACLEKDIEPLQWFGYRRRLWEVKQDLENAICIDVGLMNQLRDLSPDGLAAMICHWHRQIERWHGGLQQRMTGGRAHVSFCMGPITAEQISLLDKLGYSYEPPRRLPRFPNKKRLQY
jgi:glycosyltransferase involved in cell wall biosynthesis